MPDLRPQHDLDDRIARARSAEAARVGGGTAKRPAKGMAQGSRVMAELIGAPTGGAIFGWVLDRWLHTTPWLLLILLVLGFVVAFRNIYRIGQERAE